MWVFALCGLFRGSPSPPLPLHCALCTVHTLWSLSRFTFSTSASPPALCTLCVCFQVHILHICLCTLHCALFTFCGLFPGSPTPPLPIHLLCALFALCCLFPCSPSPPLPLYLHCARLYKSLIPAETSVSWLYNTITWSYNSIALIVKIVALDFNTTDCNHFAMRMIHLPFQNCYNSNQVN